MKPRLTTAAAVLITFATLAIPGHARAESAFNALSSRHSAAPQFYALHSLSMPKRATYGVARANNNNGLAVGWTMSNSNVSAEIWRLTATGREAGRQDLAPPRGYSGTGLVTIDDGGVAVGWVSPASDGSGLSITYPAYFRAGAWHILRGPRGQLIQGQASAIASNGVIGGTIWDARLGQNAAATFTPSSRGVYGPALFLPLAPAATGSEVGAMYSAGATTVIGGNEGLTPLANGQDRKSAVVWIDGRGPYAEASLALPGALPVQSVTGLYRADSKTMLAAGYQYFSVDGVTSTQGLIESIDISTSVPVFGPVKVLPIPLEATFAYAGALGGGTKGNPGTFTIGGTISDWAGATAAALWSGKSVGGSLSLNLPKTPNQSASGEPSQCPAYQIESINGSGEAVGFTFCDGEAKPVAVYPQGPR